MSFFRKALPVGTVILGASLGSAAAYFGSNLSPSPAAALTTNAPDGSVSVTAPGVSAGASPAIPVIQRDDLELKFVQIFFRHGARTPLGSFPSFEEAYWDKETLFQGAPNTCVEYKVCSLDGGPQPNWEVEERYRMKPLKGGSYKGQLTARGMQQAYDLGLRIKDHYRDTLGFLPEDFNPDLIYTRSTNINRTLQSLGCVMGGLYGPSISSKQAPVTFFVEKSPLEILYPNSGRCKQLMYHYTSVFKDMFKVPGVQHATNQLAPLLSLKDEEKNKLDFIRLRDDITARIEHNNAVPEFVIPVMNIIEKYAVIVTRYLIAGEEGHEKGVIRFSAGPTMHYLSQTLDAASKKEIPYKLHLNSCHDTTLMTILLALDAFDDVWPPLTAAVTFELYQDKTGNSFVRALYENKELRICQSKETLIPMDKFKQLIAPVVYTTDDFEEKCKIPVHSH